MSIAPEQPAYSTNGKETGTALVNNPTQEYGIFIQNTLNTAVEADGK